MRLCSRPSATNPAIIGKDFVLFKELLADDQNQRIRVGSRADEGRGSRLSGTAESLRRPAEGLRWLARCREIRKRAQWLAVSEPPMNITSGSRKNSITRLRRPEALINQIGYQFLLGATPNPEGSDRHV